jgi:RNA polymerase-binding transcription factor DksA
MNSNEQKYHKQLTLERIAALTTLSRLSAQNSYDPAVDRQQREQIQLKVHRIEAALHKLDAGAGFGVCQQCGNAIQPERLELLPYAELCVNCQRQLERRTFSERRLTPAAYAAA